MKALLLIALFAITATILSLNSKQPESGTIARYNANQHAMLAAIDK